MAEVINEVTQQTMPTPSKGTAGLDTQLPGQATTVSGLAAASGGIGTGHLFETDLDKDLFEFEGDETPLMQLVLLAKHIKVNSPEVDHPLIDEEKTTVTTSANLAESSALQAILPLEASEQALCKIYDTLRVRGVDGYDKDGAKTTPGIDLELYVTGRDNTTNGPIVRAVNGPRNAPTDVYCTVPAIPAGTTIDILSNALSETQKEVPPSSSIPVMDRIYLQKRAMNRIVSDYFESQRKHIPFTNAMLAERDIRRFKQSCERSYWVGIQGKMPKNDEKTGQEDIYFSKGIRWMFRREINMTGKWTFEKFIALAKMFYSSKVDVPKGAICLAGDNFMEGIQTLDWSKHPEIQINVTTDNELGWEITRIHTIFGDFDFKRTSTLTRLGYSNSCAIIGKKRLVDYYRTSEHSDKERIEGHEATRESTIRWDGPALKGTCNLFVNGEGSEAAANAVKYVLWSNDTMPTGSDLVNGTVYYFLSSPTDNTSIKAGTTWLYSKGVWSEFSDEIMTEEEIAESKKSAA